MRIFVILLGLASLLYQSYLPCDAAITHTNQAQENAKVSKVAAYQLAPQQVRVVINLDRSIQYHYFNLSNPDRAVLDLLTTKPVSLTNLPTFHHVSWINSMRIAPNDIAKQRVVFNLTRAVNMKTSLLAPTKTRPWRLVIDLSPKVKTKSKFKPKPVISTSHNSNKNITAATASQARVSKVADFSNTDRCVNIVIDPGHGGRDTGGIGLQGILEKDIVLSIGQLLNKKLAATPGICSFMTRDSDYFISLRGRLAIARKDKADVFIAIHADIFHDPKARGASVFALSNRGATSESARWLAQRENTSELLGGTDLADKSDNLKSVLLNLSQHATSKDSVILGNDVLQQLNKISHLHHHKVEQAGFVVLKSPDIPSILVETGFLSNTEEEQQLRQLAYRKKVADALYQGIMQYVRAYPPPGSQLLAWQRGQAQSYVVQTGDSLSAIALKFHTTVTKLRRNNHLTTDHIYVGQQLVV